MAALVEFGRSVGPAPWVVLAGCLIALFLDGCGSPAPSQDTAATGAAATPLAPAAVRLEIDGVPSLGWGQGKECTFVGALEAALAATDRPCSYVDLMGWSGLAMRARWYRGEGEARWCPSSPVGEFPDEFAALRQATGWALRVECRMGRENQAMTDLAPEIVASIRAGRAVPAYTKDLNMGVVYGYDDRGQTLLVRGYAAETPSQLSISELGPMAIFLEPRGTPLPRDEAVREALRIAVRNWRREPVVSLHGKYLYGEAALRGWAEDLGRAGDLDGRDRNQLFFCSWWTFDGLWDARKAAAAFLDAAAETFEGDGRAAVERAAALYREDAAALEAAQGDFLGPWTGKNVADWSAEVRSREQAVLLKACEIEGRAIAELEKALATEGHP